MQQIAPAPAAVKPRHSPDSLPSQRARLRRLAHQLERLNVTGRLDPEEILDGKFNIVRGMLALARELDA